MHKIITLIAVLFSLNAIAQDKKIIDHTDYSRWRAIKNSSISNDGKYIAYEAGPELGDGYLYIYNTETHKLDSIHRGTGASFSGRSSYLAFTIRPGYDTLRTCELKKIKKVKWPKDSLGIYMLANDSLVKMPKLGSFELNDENDWGAFMFTHNKIKEPKKKKRLCKKKRAKEYSSRGHAVMVFNSNWEEKKEFKDISKMEMSEDGGFIAMTVHQKIKDDSTHLFMFKTSNQEMWVADFKFKSIQKLAFNEQETQLAYLSSQDTSKVKDYSLTLLDLNSHENKILADTNSGFFPELETVSIHYHPYFSKDGSILYFGVAEREFEEPKDTLLESEKVKVDLWHHKDKRLQPQQLLELRRDKKQSDLYAYRILENRAVLLANDTLKARAKYDLKSNYILGASSEAYAHTYNWVSPRPRDYYRIDIESGSSEMIAKGVGFGVDLAPSGEHFVYFNSEEDQYYVHFIDEQIDECMTCGTDKATWTYDMNGQPMDAYPLGVEGWNSDESKIYLQSKYDLWEYDVNAKSISNLTWIGAENNIRVSPRWWSYDSVYVDFENIYFQGFDEKTKGAYLYELIEDGDHFDMIETARFDAKIAGLERSKDKSRHVIRTMTFNDYPDLYTYTDDVMQSYQVSDINPHQDEYNWGTVELTKWTSYKGVELEGLIYKPENFDPNKEYPMISYFYELNSDNLYNYWTPKATRAALVYSIAEYTSAGYVVFVPDVRYEPGHPADGAYDCILSGTDHLLELYPNIDSNRMAIQGQSWGGYQTAQLITMTDRYAVAMAGAPVTNMFSAYGGIRWGSGYNRQFQYERTQSRIGYTIWERPDLYIENSPQFHLPNVQTPLLIMHNDGDGAVPWYQGIELFTGLKRLDKEVWMLNYNDDGHNLTRLANRIDLSIRMRQFFDYYLLGAEAPQWLLEGIPAVVKGKELRY